MPRILTDEQSRRIAANFAKAIADDVDRRCGYWLDREQLERLEEAVQHALAVTLEVPMERHGTEGS